MKLYFQHSNGELELVKSDVSISDHDFQAVSEALADLEVRAPHFHSYYQRVWKDGDGVWWIDVGDHYCFYVVVSD